MSDSGLDWSGTEEPVTNEAVVTVPDGNEADNDNKSSSMIDHPPWCISIKTVGDGFDHTRFASSSSSSSSPSFCSTEDNSNGTCTEKIFNVHVNPHDGVDSLHEAITEVTGLKTKQQRLIYRGRLIGTSDVDDSDNERSSTTGETDPDTRNDVDDAGTFDDEGNNPKLFPPQKQTHEDQPPKRKIKDINGLCDGQTIHLMKKRDVTSGQESSTSGTTSGTNNSATRSSTNNSNTSTTLDDELSSVGGGGALLAALLGLGSLGDESSNHGDGSIAADGVRNNNNNNRTRTLGASNGSDTASSSWRSPSSTTATSGSSLFGRTHRRPHYRYSADDLRVPDPGSMESVRQGMMTLHTLLPHSQLHRQEGTSPLEANREWFRGQWIDALDTVNQWLEATVVEIVFPHELLPPEASNGPYYDTRRPPQVYTDSAVHANDLEGRRRLLIQPCEPGDPEELSGELVGFKPRQNNGVQLLLVHYNGWPHRWDEWIRSDSDRIRPFRSRTRHPTSSTHVSPTPQSIFTEAPRTNIRPGDDEEDRDALLPELYRVMSQVTNLLGEMIDERPASGNEIDQRDNRVEANLPWLANHDIARGQSRDSSEICNIIEPIDTDDDEDDDDDGTHDLNDHNDEGREHIGNSDHSTRNPRSYTQREMRNFATLLDRLGRTLTDAAPHVASVAASIPDDALSASSSLAVASTTRAGSSSSSQDQSSSTPLGGLLSLWSSSRERRLRQSNIGPDSDAGSNVDPDHYDFAGGLVNTTRGEVRSGPRNRSASDELATLLGTYLAAASLNSLVNSESEGGGGGNVGTLIRSSNSPSGGTGAAGRGEGGEVAIHIQAVFTSPGAGSPGATGTATAVTGRGIGQNATVSPTQGARNWRPSILRPRAGHSSNNATNNDDDESLFSDLYSATPTPIDPNNNIDSALQTTTATINESNRSSLRDDQGTNVGSMSTQDNFPSRLSSRSTSRRQPRDRRGSGILRIFRRRGQQNGQDEN